MKSQATLNDLTLPVADFLQVDAACDRFEAAYHAGESPDLAAYLSAVPVRARMPLFRYLLSLDIDIAGAGASGPTCNPIANGSPNSPTRSTRYSSPGTRTSSSTNRAGDRAIAIDGAGDTRPDESREGEARAAGRSGLRWVRRAEVRGI